MSDCTLLTFAFEYQSLRTDSDCNVIPFLGRIEGYAANMELMNHYFSVFIAEHIAMLHPFQLAIYEEAAELREVYDYEWTDEEI